jgi:hypothetical protein
MKELDEIDKAAVNRPVSDLARSAEQEIIDVITHQGNSEGTPITPAAKSQGNGNSHGPSGLGNGHANAGNGHGHKHVSRAATHAERVKIALGNMYMDTACSHCGSSKVIRAGACGVCTDCGTSQGCS